MLFLRVNLIFDDWITFSSRIGDVDLAPGVGARLLATAPDCDADEPCLGERIAAVWAALLGKFHREERSNPTTPVQTRPRMGRPLPCCPVRGLHLPNGRLRRREKPDCIRTLYSRRRRKLSDFSRTCREHASGFDWEAVSWPTDVRQAGIHDFAVNALSDTLGFATRCKVHAQPLI